MRLLLIPLAAVGFACAGPGDRLPTDPPAPPVTFTVSGTVIDSVSGLPLAGVAVETESNRFLTDGNGEFRFEASPGLLTLFVDDPAYATSVQRLTVDRRSLVDFRLLRRAPFLTRCVISGDRVVASLVDLQGRKTIDRWYGSDALLEGAGFRTRVDAIRWGWQAVDILTWRIEVGTSGVPLTRVEFSLADSEGNRTNVTCAPGQGPGEEV